MKTVQTVKKVQRTLSHKEGDRLVDRLHRAQDILDAVTEKLNTLERPDLAKIAQRANELCDDLHERILLAEPVQPFNAK